MANRAWSIATPVFIRCYVSLGYRMALGLSSGAYIPANLCTFNSKIFSPWIYYAMSCSGIMFAKVSFVRAIDEGEGMSSAKSIVFVDGHVEDAASLLEGIPPSAETFILDHELDGLSQIAAVLAEREGISTIHVLSHGAEGMVQLGCLELTDANVASRAIDLSAIGSALGEEAEILLYSCDTAASTRGKALVDALSILTGANVAASTTPTGNASMGGDWALQYQTGVINSQPLAVTSYQHVLASTTFDFETVAQSTVSKTISQTIGSDTMIFTATDANLLVDTELNAFGSDVSNASGKVMATGEGGLYIESSLNLSVAGGKTFDLTSFTLAKLGPDGLQITLTSSKGSETVAISFVGDSWVFNTSVMTHPSYFQGVSSISITTNGVGYFEWGFDNIVLSNIIDPTAPPTTTVSTVAPFPDTNSSNTDFITNTPSQTISGTLSANLVAGESVQVSIDGGTSWSNAISSVGSNTWSFATTLIGSITLAARVTNVNGSSTAYTQAFILDTTAPTNTFSNLSFLPDTGTSNTDFITNTASQTIKATLNTGITGTDVVYGSLDNGATWVNITSKLSGTSLSWNGVTLSSSSTLKLKVTDNAGNDGTIASQAYVLDTTAPTTTFGALKLSLDTGSSSSDFITKTPAQTITATLSSAPAGSDEVYGSLDNGATWSNITSKLSGTALTWDGVTLSGSNTVQLKVTDIAGNDGTIKSQAYVLDISAPATPSTPVLDSASDTGASSSDRITNNTTPTITGTAESGSTVTLYDTDGTTVLGTGVATGGAYSIAVSALTSTSHTITAKATDVAGNTSAASSGTTLTIDTSAPTTVALSATSATTVNATAGATLASLSATDNSAITYSLVAGNGTNDSANNLFTLTGGTLKPVGNLAAGSYNIYVSATDVAGNHSEQAFTFNVSNGPSVGSIVRTGGGSTIVDHAATSLTYTVTFNEAVTGVDTSDFTLVKTSSANGTIGGISTTDNITYTVTVSGLSGDGTLGLDLNASGTGIQNGSSANIAGGYSGQVLTLDHTSPVAPGAPIMTTATDTGTSNSDGITNNATPAFTGTAEANSTVTLYDTDGVTSLGSASANGSGKWSITSSALTNATHTLTAKAVDAAGNSSTASSALSVTIETSAAAPGTPALSAGSDSGMLGDGITNVSTPTITGTGTNGATATLYDTDGTTVLGSAVVNSSGIWSITSSALSQGSHSLTTKQVTLAGNTSVASAVTTLTIDTTAPIPPGGLTLAAASDSGTLGDGITNVTTPSISGTAEANSKVTLYDSDGATVLGTATASGAGAWSVTSSALSLGNHTLTAKQTDLAGNVSVASTALTLSIIATPSAPVTPSVPSNLIDGVPVSTTSVVLPGGVTGTLLTVPTVPVGAGTSVGAANVADIPLVTSGSTILLASQVPIGAGLTSAGGPSQPAGNSSSSLLAAIQAQTRSHDLADQNHLSGNGTQFLGLLPSTIPLLVNTIVIQGTAPNSTTPLTLTGTSTANQHTALVIDTSTVTNSTVVLQKVDFAAVIGAATVISDTAGQILTGDASNQTFIIASNNGNQLAGADTTLASQVHAGAGNDVLQYGLPTNATTVDALNASLLANSTTTGSLSAATSVLLNGGTGSDTAVFSKAHSAYIIDQRDGYVLVTDKADATQRITVTNTESLKFSDSQVSVESRTELTTLAGLYQTAFGRQADINGFDFWGAQQAKGVSLGSIAVSMLGSNEAAVRGFALNGDKTHDITVLYRAVFGRDPEGNGLAYWQSQMSQGQSIVDVANGFMAATEISEHKLAVSGWDMNF